MGDSIYLEVVDCNLKYFPVISESDSDFFATANDPQPIVNKTTVTNTSGGQLATANILDDDSTCQYFPYDNDIKGSHGAYRALYGFPAGCQITFNDNPNKIAVYVAIDEAPQGNANLSFSVKTPPGSPYSPLLYINNVANPKWSFTYDDTSQIISLTYAIALIKPLSANLPPLGVPFFEITSSYGISEITVTQSTNIYIYHVNGVDDAESKAVDQTQKRLIASPGTGGSPNPAVIPPVVTPGPGTAVVNPGPGRSPNPAVVNPGPGPVIPPVVNPGPGGSPNPAVVNPGPGACNTKSCIEDRKKKQTSSKSEQLSTGAVAGIVAGSIAAIGIVALGTVMHFKSVFDKGAA